MTRRRLYRDPMRWGLLFGDIEAQLEEALRLERESSAAELERAEFARVPFLDRMRGSEGRAISLVLSGAGRLEGVVKRVGNGWLVLEDGPSDWLVCAGAIRAVSGLSRTVPPEEGLLWQRLGLGSALRTVSRDRSVVRVFFESGGLEHSPPSGVIARVGLDFLELWEAGERGEGRRTQTVRVIPFDGIAAVQGGAGSGTFRGV